MFPMMPPQGNKQERQLLKVFKSLNDEDKASLIAFSEFLSARITGENTPQYAEKTTDFVVPDEPLGIPRPDDESVIKAIKRLTKTYPMVDKEKILNPISGVMTSHIMQGKSAKEAIDELEVLFMGEYEQANKSE